MAESLAVEFESLVVEFLVSKATAERVAEIAPDELKERLTKALSVALAKRSTADAPVEWKRAIVAKAEDSGEEERYVLGVVMEPDSVDTQGDTQTAETIREAAFQFMEEYRDGGGHLGLMHEQIVDGKIAILESYIQKNDETIGKETLKKGSWMMAVRVYDDELWDQVKKGELTGFSIGGTAVRRKPGESN